MNNENKPNKFSVVGLIFGFFFSLFFAARYIVYYPDTDRAIVYTLIGLIIMGLSWLYDEITKLKYVVDVLDLVLNSMVPNDN